MKGKLFLGVILVAAVGFLARPWLFPKRVPDIDLPTNTGEQASLLDLGGRPEGVLLYLGVMPGDQQKGPLKMAIQTEEALAKSHDYAVKVVYGQEDPAAAMAYAQKLGGTILVDGGNTLAKKLGIEYAAIVAYGPDGKVKTLHNKAFIRMVVKTDDILHAMVK